MKWSKHYSTLYGDVLTLVTVTVTVVPGAGLLYASIQNSCPPFSSFSFSPKPCSCVVVCCFWILVRDYMRIYVRHCSDQVQSANVQLEQGNIRGQSGCLREPGVWRHGRLHGTYSPSLRACVRPLSSEKDNPLPSNVRFPVLSSRSSVCVFVLKERRPLLSILIMSLICVSAMCVFCCLNVNDSCESDPNRYRVIYSEWPIGERRRLSVVLSIVQPSVGNKGRQLRRSSAQDEKRLKVGPYDFSRE